MIKVHRGIDSIQHIDGISRQRFDGILVISQSDADNPFIYHLKKTNIPIVVLNRQLEDASIMNVLASDRIGVKEAIDYAISQGHRKLPMIEGRPDFKVLSKVCLPIRFRSD